MRAVRIVATEISRRCDDYDPRLPRSLHFLAERIESVAFIDGVAQRQVDNADVVGALELNRPMMAAMTLASCPAPF